jgi:hypothetical protein
MLPSRKEDESLLIIAFHLSCARKARRRTLPFFRAISHYEVILSLPKDYV